MVSLLFFHDFHDSKPLSYLSPICSPVVLNNLFSQLIIFSLLPSFVWKWSFQDNWFPFLSYLKKIILMSLRISNNKQGPMEVTFVGGTNSSLVKLNGFKGHLFLYTFNGFP